MVLQIQLQQNGVAENHVHPDVFALACSPDFRVSRYASCIVNGVRFSTLDRDKNRKTENSGIMLRGVKNDNNEEQSDYYGVQEIICLQYHVDRTEVLF